MKKAPEIKRKGQLNTADTKGVVYIGHLPKGFEEHELVGYFKQFGEVNRVRVSRSKKTGQSKGYGYVQFKDEEVANIVADTMNNYIMFRKSLKAHVVEPEKIHKDLFNNCDKLFAPSKGRQRAIARFNRTAKKPEHFKKRQHRREMALKKLRDRGYEIKVADTKPVDEKSGMIGRGYKKLLPKKSVHMAETPVIIRDAHDSDSDDEISFKPVPADLLEKTEEDICKQEPTHKRVFPRTPIPKKNLQSVIGVSSPLDADFASPTLSSRAKKFSSSDASPALAIHTRVKTETSKQTHEANKEVSPKTVCKTPPTSSKKFSPRVTRSAAKKRKVLT
ncbi:MKI67 FHA domain-interacting nucleolar phosphoprotein-like [Watersipora subatra]|uniref:MKI67 FHA domain-interacting nucleolar phosphoprotein-like n=1 Tax=Watersipora subatra TaxID=2589382 RepID=UPI00355B8F1A